MHKTWHIRGGNCLDPVSGTARIRDLYIDNGIISPIPREIPADAGIIDARGLFVTPGFIDIHVHLREPGNEESETIESGTRAAAKGGFTTIVSMPNTQPPTDSPELISLVAAKGREHGWADVLPSACITKHRQGRELADLKNLAKAGAVAFTDDGATVPDNTVMANAMSISRELGIPVFDHALDPVIAGRGVMHEGRRSKQLGLPGIPSMAEATAVERDINLSDKTGCTVHIQHISARESIDLIRQAQSKGLKVSGEATPHHLILTDEDVRADSADFKMNPPVRSEEDRLAILSAVADGTIQALATDHAPHTRKAKDKGFIPAPFGIIGLETAVGITYSILVRTGLMPLIEWVRRWTTGPAGIIRLQPPSLEAGKSANITILDLNSEWTVSSNDFLSKSKNMPFNGRRLVGKSVYTFLNGKMTWKSSGQQ